MQDPMSAGMEEALRGIFYTPYVPVQHFDHCDEPSEPCGRVPLDTDDSSIDWLLRECLLCQQLREA